MGNCPGWTIVMGWVRGNCPSPRPPGRTKAQVGAGSSCREREEALVGITCGQETREAAIEGWRGPGLLSLKSLDAEELGHVL